jgi:hypothetical protein
MSKPPRLTKLANRIVEAAVKLASDDEQELVFRHGIFCQVGLPHSRQIERRFERTFKNASVLIQAGALWDGYKWVEQPLPFGAKPRVAMYYIDSEAVKNKSVFIDIGKSFNQFGERIGIPAQGKNFYEMKRQMNALSVASMTLGFTSNVGKPNTVDLGRPIKRFEAWFTRDDRQQPLWPGQLELSPDYLETLLEHAVPIPLEAIKALTHSSLSLDLLNWAARRLPTLKREERIPYVAFKEQFGQEYKELKDFQRTFLHAMRQVQTVYKDAKIETVKGGLLFKPSKPMVAKRYTQGHSMPLEPPKAIARYLPTSELTERAIGQFRAMFPRLDVYACKAAFDAWLPTAPEQPKNYQRAFIGFAKSWGRQQR